MILSDISTCKTAINNYHTNNGKLWDSAGFWNLKGFNRRERFLALKSGTILEYIEISNMKYKVTKITSNG